MFGTTKKRSGGGSPEGEASQGGVAPCTAPVNAQPLRVCLALLGQVLGSVGAVCHIHNAPVAPQPVPILSPIPGAATVVDICQGKACIPLLVMSMA